MCDHQCGSIPVVRDQTSRYLVGIVTSSDIACRILAQRENPAEKTAQDCMSVSVVTIDPEASLEECCVAMEHNRIRRILVIDANGMCCGIVSLDELAYWVPNEMTATLLRAVVRPLRSALRFAAASAEGEPASA